MKGYILLALLVAILTVGIAAAADNGTNDTSDIILNSSAINETIADNGTSDSAGQMEPRSPTENDSLPSYLTATGENQTQKDVALEETGLPVVGIVLAFVAAIGLVCKRR